MREQWLPCVRPVAYTSLVDLRFVVLSLSLAACSHASRPTVASGAAAPRVSAPRVSALSLDRTPVAVSVEHARVAQGSSGTLRQRTYTFSRWAPDGLADPVGHVVLTQASGEALEARTNGCMHADRVNLRVDSIAPGPPAVADLSFVAHEPRVAEVQWGAATEVELGDSLRTPSGDVLLIRRFYERMGALLWDAEVRSGALAVESMVISLSEATFAGDRIVSNQPTGRRDALGCQIARLTVERPSVQIIQAVDGAEVRVRWHGRVSLGALTVRYDSLTERRMVRGTRPPLVDITTVVGASTERHTLEPRRPLSLNGYGIEVLDASSRWATLRLTTIHE
ncbi:MAG: hypothetical protein Q8Q09_20555 [Deltaproteobacteria bacterium]|nr:hypothetical protein [Deltaproteobacteria bacterium]